METIKCNYKYLVKWLRHNPKIRTFTEFANAMGYSVQRIHYNISKESFMNKEIIEKAKTTFNLTDEQVERFFYTKKLSK